MCTNFRLKSADNAVVIGRTMEFGFDLQSKLIVYPRNFTYTAQTPPGGFSPLSWTGKYGVVAPDAFSQQAASDGMNEKGLYVGCLYFPGYVQYSVPTSQDNGKLVSQLDFALWVLSLFETVEEVKVALPSISVWGMEYGELGLVPLHFSVQDAAGNSIVIEHTKEGLKVHDNPLGVLTNSPEFPWHMINLSNYVNLSATNVPGLNLTGDALKPIGEGSGMLGLPGDFTPPSRFVRATALTQSALPAKSAEEEVKTAFHILGSFDIPLGLTREKHGEKTYYEYTQWMTVADLASKIYYFKTYNTPGIIKVDLLSLNFDKAQKQVISLDKTPWFTDVTATAA